MFFNDGFNILRLYTAIKGAFRINDNQRTVLAEAMAACFDNHNLILQAGNIVKELHGELLAEKQRAIGLEQVVELDPDVIFVVVIESHYGHEQDMIDRVTQHKALKNLRCVKEGRVVALPLYAIYSSGVRTYDGIKIIAAGMYPDLYKEK